MNRSPQGIYGYAEVCTCGYTPLRERIVVRSKCVRDENKTLKVIEEEVIETWKSYFSSLLNETNEYQLEEEDKVEGLKWGVTEQTVEQALKSMKVGKVPGPSGVTNGLIKVVGATGVKGLFRFVNPLNSKVKFQSSGPRVICTGMYKGKGNVLMVSKHSGVRLLEQDVKVNEKTLEKRLRDKFIIVKIDEKQFGFQPGNSTVDAIFVLRQLQEKFGAKKKGLFHVFVDLEKAFDCVPRKTIKWALRCQKCLSVSYYLLGPYNSNASSRVKTQAGNSDEIGIGRQVGKYW